MAQATDSSISGKVASYLSRLNPIPRLPEYTGPYKVGTVDVEIPISDLESPAPAPADASEIETIQFRIFYPAQPDSEGKRITWLPAPQRDNLSAYIKFLGIAPFWAQAASFLPRHLHYTSIPVIKNAPLLEPPGDPGRRRRWPTAVFSHGLGGNRNAYSQIAGSLASHGAVVVCPEHRDGSAAASFVRIPAAQDRYFARSKRREVAYRRIPHDATDEVHGLRNAQLRIRLWEMGLLHEALLALDGGDGGGGGGGDGPGRRFENLNASTPDRALEQFAGRLDVLDPGSMIFMGHSFGAATTVQFLKSVYYADHPEVAAMEDPLYCPRPGSAIRRQITPRNVTVLLDMWCFPLLAKSTKALFERPLPAYDTTADSSSDAAPAPAPGGRAILAVESEDFFKWTEHLHASARALSPDPRAPVVEADLFAPPTPGGSSSVEQPRFFYVRRAAHLSQSDFGVLFPLLTRRVFGSEEPERALRLNLRAVLQVLRDNGVPVARTAWADLVDGGSAAAASARYDKLVVEEDDSDAEDESGAEERGEDGIRDDKAILDRSNAANIDAWEYIDIVGMGRVVDKDDGEVKGGDEVAEKQDSEMAGVIEPNITDKEGAAMAVVSDIPKVASTIAV